MERVWLSVRAPALGRTLLSACVVTTASCAASDSENVAVIGDAGALDARFDPGDSQTVESQGCRCSDDLKSVLQCSDNSTSVLRNCDPDQACNPETFVCETVCQAVAKTKSSVGCDFYATYLEAPLAVFAATDPSLTCFVAFVTNAWDSPAHLSVDYGGKPYAPESFTYLPQGRGSDMTYQRYDATRGLLPGEAAVLFLGGANYTDDSFVGGCQFPSAAGAGAMVSGAGMGKSFHIVSDVPLSAYQNLGYGDSVQGASLLLPTNAWGTQYMTIDPAVPFDFPPPPDPPVYSADPDINIVAQEDGTHVTFFPVVDVQAMGNLFGATAAGASATFTIDRGQHAQLSQSGVDLTGSVVKADKAIGVMGAHPGVNGNDIQAISFDDVAYASARLQQMLPPVYAWGNEYVAVTPRPRMNTPGLWRVVGMADGTSLTYVTATSTAIDGAPTTLRKGENVYFQSGDPFVVRSQDSHHAFMLFEYMQSVPSPSGTTDYTGGGAGFSIAVSPLQYLANYNFVADAQFTEVNLVVIRAKGTSTSAPVILDCAGELGGWTSVGDYEWTRTDLAHGDNFVKVGNCSAGPHHMTSTAPFGVTVWTWQMSPGIINESGAEGSTYGYPAGMNVLPINDSNPSGQ